MAEVIVVEKPSVRPRPELTAGRLDLAAILALIVGANLLAGAMSNGLVVATVHISAAAIAVAGARLRGYSADELALSPKAFGDGLRLGLMSAAVIIGAVVTIAVVPFSRQFFSDDRFADLDGLDVLYETAFRIPVITALTEELLFRSVLLGILLTLTSTRSAVLVSAVVFGLWHVLTTLGDLAENDVTDSFAIWGRVLAVAATVAATGVAGVIFGWLRVRSRSVLAPWIAHIAFNASAFLAGVVVVQNNWA